MVILLNGYIVALILCKINKLNSYWLLSEKSDLRPTNLSEVRLHKVLKFKTLNNACRIFFA